MANAQPQIVSRLLRLLTFGALYFAQGVPWGFISVGYVVFMADHGLNNEQVGGAIALAYLPWSFKLVWGALVDRFPSARFGRRRPYIVVAELGMGLSLLALVLLSDLEHQLGLVSAILFVHNVFASIQDVAVDALAVDVLRADERGRANAIMWAAKSLGISAGGGGGVVLSRHIGWNGLMVAMAVVIWLIMLLPLLLSERAMRAAEALERRLSLRALRESFAFAAPRVGVLIAFVAPFGYSLASAFETRMMRADLHFGDGAIGTLNGVVAPATGFVGSLLGGVVADRFGTRRTLAGAMVGMALCLAVFALARPHWGSLTVWIVYTVALGTCQYVYGAASLGFFMTLSNPAIGATHFACYMAATNLCYSATAKAGGYLADHLGYVPTYFVAAAIQLAAIALLPLCDERTAEARFRPSS